jgi:hypothetical protein
VIDASAVERCEWFVETARKEGAKVLVGGEAAKVDGKVIATRRDMLKIGIFLSTDIVGRLFTEPYFCTT